MQTKIPTILLNISIVNHIRSNWSTQCFIYNSDYKTKNMLDRLGEAFSYFLQWSEHLTIIPKKHIWTTKIYGLHTESKRIMIGGNHLKNRNDRSYQFNKYHHWLNFYLNLLCDWNISPTTVACDLEFCFVLKPNLHLSVFCCSYGFLLNTYYYQPSPQPQFIYFNIFSSNNFYITLILWEANLAIMT